jgi:hypothetical protein
MVPNPLYEALGDALRVVEPLITEVEKNIEAPFQQLRSGVVWAGPAAQRFDAQLSQYRSRVLGAGDKVLSDLRLALARTPRQVTEDEARAIRNRYGLS